MNELLYWMSARHAGTAQSFRSKVAELGAENSGGRLHRLAEWNLSKLGHAEFRPAATDDGWRVAPPVLAAGDASAQSHAVLCGARTPRLMARLAEAAGAASMRTRPQPWGPDVVEVSAGHPSELEAIATAAGIRLQWNAALAVLSCASSPKRQDLQPTTVPIGGWAVSQFAKTFEWIPGTQQAAAEATFGLFRFRSDYETVYIVIEDGRAWSCDPAVGKYRILKRRNRALSYSCAEKILSIHAGCRPPALIERALVLCSGQLPEFDAGRVNYPCVEIPVAAAVASMLGQRLA